jgi:hypothetical protein
MPINHPDWNRREREFDKTACNLEKSHGRFPLPPPAIKRAEIDEPPPAGMSKSLKEKFEKRCLEQDKINRYLSEKITSLEVKMEKILRENSELKERLEEVYYPPESEIRPEFIQKIEKICEEDAGKVYGSMNDFLKSLDE